MLRVLQNCSEYVSECIGIVVYHITCAHRHKFNPCNCSVFIRGRVSFGTSFILLWRQLSAGSMVTFSLAAVLRTHSIKQKSRQSRTHAIRWWASDRASDCDWAVPCGVWCARWERGYFRCCRRPPSLIFFLFFFRFVLISILFRCDLALYNAFILEWYICTLRFAFSKYLLDYCSDECSQQW